MTLLYILFFIWVLFILFDFKKAVLCYAPFKILFYYENLSVEEISQITNTNILTVRKQLSMVRKQLKELLKEA